MRICQYDEFLHDIKCLFQLQIVLPYKIWIDLFLGLHFGEKVLVIGIGLNADLGVGFQDGDEGLKGRAFLLGMVM